MFFLCSCLPAVIHASLHLLGLYETDVPTQDCLSEHKIDISSNKYMYKLKQY